MNLLGPGDLPSEESKRAREELDRMLGPIGDEPNIDITVHVGDSDLLVSIEELFQAARKRGLLA